MPVKQCRKITILLPVSLKFIVVFHAYGRRLAHNIAIVKRKNVYKTLLEEYNEYNPNATQLPISVSCFFVIEVSDFSSSRLSVHSFLNCLTNHSVQSSVPLANSRDIVTAF
jgi:hypothetical protein